MRIHEHNLLAYERDIRVCKFAPGHMNTAKERPRICKHVVLSENFDRSECLTKENMFILFLSYHLHV